MNAALEGEALVVRLGGAVVLDRVSVALPAACWTAIVGPNGAGKSTLLRTLAGLQAAESGRVRLLGQAIGQMAARERGRSLAWLGQQAEAAAELNARDVVRLGRLPHHGLFGVPDAADEQAVADAMRRCECEAYAGRMLATLSGGERQRVLLARVLAVGAPVMVLDEPTTHLDPPHQVAVSRLMREEARRGRCVAAVLHDLTLALAADRVVVIAGGKVVVQGGPGEGRVQQAVVEVFDAAIDIVEAAGRLAAISRV